MKSHFNPSPRYFYVIGSERAAVLEAASRQNPLHYAAFYLKDSTAPTYLISYDDNLSNALELLIMGNEWDIVELTGENLLKVAYRLNRWQLFESPSFAFQGDKDLIERKREL